MGIGRLDFCLELGNVVLRGRTYVFPGRLSTEALKIF